MLNNEKYFDNKIILKPWGYEYVIFRNKSKLSITLVNIKYKKSTSLHSHPQKKTGFIILNGNMQVQVGLYKNSIKNYSPLSRLVIRPGLFHSLRSISSKGTRALEIETPVRKNDLLRFRDNYGRKGKPYEKLSLRDLVKDDVVFKKPKKNNSKVYKFENIKITLKYIKNIIDLKNFKNNSTCAILDGGIFAKNNIPVLNYGEIVRIETVKKFLKFYSVKNKMLVLVASKL